MKRMLVGNWDMVLVRGILAILFGIAALVMPGVTLKVLVVLFGGYALVNGVISSVIAIKDREEYSNWWLLLLAGLVSMGVGIVTFVWPDITTKTLFYLIVIWAILTGVIEILLAIEFRKVIKGEWLLVLEGILSVAFGVLLIAQPKAGALAVLWLIGLYAIAYGVLLVVLAFRLRNLEVEVDALLTDIHQAHQS
jgi:uncharacterized membrane protein HdeD (DUF308 family)